jgi:pimeloyl-ACP methyl ester carboxylesterase
MREGEIRALGEVAAQTIARPTSVARDVHAAVTHRVFAALGPLGAPVRMISEPISQASYRAVSAALRAPLAGGGRALARTASGQSASLSESPLGGFALGALNGFFGDRLARDHPDLAVELTIRRHGREIALGGDALARAYPAATPKLAVFVHGLCGTERTWGFQAPGAEPRPTYGALLRDDLGYSPVYVRYNTGLHVSDNGRRLAETIDQLVAEWPADVEDIALIGHSMGGLVARSACHYGDAEDQRWTERIRHVFCLGAPLEQAANVAGWAFNRLPETRPFGDLFINGRSVGIKDLRFGSCVEEDWTDCDPDEFIRDRCCEVPFLPDAAYYFIGATITPRADGIGALVGDLLVRYPSASGQGRRRRIPFEIDHGRHLGSLNHLQLLNHPAVYAQVRDWIERGDRRSIPARSL